MNSRDIIKQRLADKLALSELEAVDTMIMDVLVEHVESLMEVGVTEQLAVKLTLPIMMLSVELVLLKLQYASEHNA
jgi:hypothetical protein